MVMQIRIKSPDGSNLTVLENATQKTLSETLNSSDETVTFEIPKNDTKAALLNPEANGYAMLWEAWDTETNTRLNYGPITQIDAGSGANWRITGRGRSAFLEDIISTKKIYYWPLDRIVDELRYENIAIEPRTTTMIHDTTSGNVAQDTFFVGEYFDGTLALGSGITLFDSHYRLSKQTKDNIIDDQTGLFPFGKEEPSRSFYTTTSYWAGMGPRDTVVVDLGAEHPIAKIKLLFPWWGGPARANDRTYEFNLSYATEGSTLQNVQGRSSSAFNNIYSTQSGSVGVPETPRTQKVVTVYGPNRLVTMPDYEMQFYLGSTYYNAGAGYEFNRFYSKRDVPGPINMRFIRVNITQVRAWYGSEWDYEAAADSYRFQCDPTYDPGDDPNRGNKLGLMTYKNKSGVIKQKEISHDKLTNANDCYASLVELGAYKEIVKKYKIEPLVLQRIDNNNMQISYSHTCLSSETTKNYMTNTSDDGTVSAQDQTANDLNLKRFEPGTFFRKFKVTYNRSVSQTAQYHKFFSKDCTNCYPDGFRFAVVDSNNNCVYMTDSYSASNLELRAGIYTSHVLMKGAADAYVSWVDAWKGKTDQLSYGGSYSYSETTNDTVTVHFRGKSFKWYATVPSGKTGATVKIEKREKNTTWSAPSIGKPGYGRTSWGAEAWNSWTTLEASYKIPDNIQGEVVYEIPYGSALLSNDTVYEIRITNLDGNFASVDSFEGYWIGSFTMYNEDSPRIKVSNQDAMKQLYDGRFQQGSMYKWNKAGAGVSIQFEGDRIIILSAKGRYHGNLTILIHKYTNFYGTYDPGVTEHIFIPGGDAENGSLTVSLEVSAKRGNESTQHIIFDSNDYFTEGLMWGHYSVSITYKSVETYETTKNESMSDSFWRRCSHCNEDTSGKTTINKYVYLDAIGVHEKVGVAVNFDQKNHLEQLRSLAEMVQCEWQVNEEGLQFEPRIGSDTDYYLREGENTLIDYSVTYDVKNVASMLLSFGSDVDGIPQFSLVEDKKNREILGRTVMRQEDYRTVGSYQQLIGLGRGELRRRRTPEKRITVKHIAKSLPLKRGDSFMLYSKQLGAMRVRINRIERSESSDGTTFTMECVKWPPTI